MYLRNLWAIILARGPVGCFFSPSSGFTPEAVFSARGFQGKSAHSMLYCDASCVII